MLTELTNATNAFCHKKRTITFDEKLSHALLAVWTCLMFSL
jgi:hypothetical protein